jgi:signal transduction histidine kinase
MHAAQLLLTSLPAGSEAAAAEPVQLALRELAAATSEMDASLTGLRTAAGGGTLRAALRGRPAQLAARAGVELDVTGADLPLADPLATHVYHVLSEAILNAIRHAQATAVETRLRHHDGHLVATVVDNGRGLSADASWDSQGVRSMIERAELVGGQLSIGPGVGGGGTTITLELPYAGELA